MYLAAHYWVYFGNYKVTIVPSLCKSSFLTIFDAKVLGTLGTWTWQWFNIACVWEISSLFTCMVHMKQKGLVSSTNIEHWTEGVPAAHCSCADQQYVCLSVCVCVCVCVRACVRACMRACVCVCVHSWGY